MFALYLNFFFLALMFITSPPVQSETVDRIVARVNKEIITLSDLRETSEPYLAAVTAKLTGPEKEKKLREVEKDILEKMIEDKLIIDKAKTMGITVSEQEMGKAIDEVKERHSIDDFQLQQLLEQQGTPIEEYRETIRNQILITKALGHEVQSKINVTEAEAKEYYERHREEFYLPEDIKARQILIQCLPNSDPSERQRARAEAEYVRKGLIDGADFGQIARKHSQDPSADKGGEIGYIKEGELLPTLEKALAKLERNAISPVIETERGFHILKVEEKRANRLRPFSELKNTIMNKLHKEKLFTRHKEWINEIKKDAFIEILY